MCRSTLICDLYVVGLSKPQLNFSEAGREIHSEDNTTREQHNRAGLRQGEDSSFLNSDRDLKLC